MRGGVVTGFWLLSEICCSGLSVAAVSQVLSFVGYWLCFSGWSLLACFGFDFLHPPAGGFCYCRCWFVGGIECFCFSFSYTVASGLAWLCFACFRVSRSGKTCCVLRCSAYIRCSLFSMSFFVFPSCCLCFLYNLVENKFGLLKKMSIMTSKRIECVSTKLYFFIKCSQGRSSRLSF